MDMKSWNTGLNMARMGEQPQNWAIQLVFDECELDTLLSSQWNNRKNQVFSSSFSLKKANGDIDEEATKILKKNPLYRSLTNSALDSILFGYNLVELSFQKNGTESKLTAEKIPRYNVVPQTGLFYPEYGDTSKSIKYRELAEFGTWILEFNSKTLGLMNKLVAPALFTRFAESCWSELCEIYGIPPRVLKTNTQDATMLKRAETMMRDMGSAAWFIIDETEEFDFAKGASTNGDVYNSLLKHCGAKICNLLSGGMIGQDTQNGARAKDEVSMEMLWLLVQSDMAMLEEAWNETIIPALVKHGVLPEGLSFEFDEAEDVAQLWKFVHGLLGYFDFDPEWIKEKFGVEVTAAKVQTDLTTTLALALAKAVPPPPGGAGGGDGGGDFFLRAPQDGACCGAHHMHDSLTLQGESEGVKSEALIERIGAAKGKAGFDADLFWDTSRTLIKGLNAGLDGKNITLGMQRPDRFSKPVRSGNLVFDFTYGMDDPHLLTSFELNLHRFSAGKTLAEVQALNEAFRNAKSYDIFKMNAKRIGDVWNDAWLKTEFDTATLVGEAATNFHNLMEDVETFPYWEYKTVGDNAVREEHAKLEGLILPANHPAWAKLFPPNGWNCRCYVVARMASEVADVDFAAMEARADTYFASDQFAKAASQGFGVNRSVTGEVFTANQQYIAGKNLTETKKLLNELTATDYGLQLSDSLLTAATKEIPIGKQAIGDFIAGLPVLKGKPILTDHKDRALNFPTGSTKGEELLEALKDTLSNPTEVWMQDKKAGYQLTYFSYYKEEIFQVIAQQEDSELNILLWRKIKAVESKRKGMLLSDGK